MKISFLLYPTVKVKVDEDSSFWIMNELVRRGHEVTYFESTHLSCLNGVVSARLRKARLDTSKGFLSSPLSAPVRLNSQRVIFIRKEPPFDNEYLYALQILSLIKQNVFILNDPDGIALLNEKLGILMFPELITDTLVTNRAEEARAFAGRLRTEVVIKPLNQKGGTGIFKMHSKDAGFHAKLYAATTGDTQKIMVQRLIPHRLKGDKRILLLNGEIIGAFLRRPARREFRANLGLGGSMHRTRVEKRDERIVAETAPLFAHHGLYFVGLDIIDGRLSEINVTSPSGIPELRQLYGTRVEKKVADFIETRLLSSSARKRSRA